jgi:hypothetical protein
VTQADVHDLAVDLSGNLYIADDVHIRRVTASGAVSTVAGDGYMHVGDGGSAMSAQLFQPSAVSLDFAGNLYIADTGTECRTAETIAFVRLRRMARSKRLRAAVAPRPSAHPVVWR